MDKKKILFVCHGNICRSPMAEYMFKEKVKNAGLSEMFEIDSAATSTEELGNPVYPPARRILASHGITNITHRARQITRADYNHFDIICIMDSENRRNIMCIIGNDPDEKIKMLGQTEIEDPWYTGNFEKVYNQIESGCEALLKELMQ